MTDVPRISVGQINADLLGADHRALQAAVHYVAGLGGGIVEIGPGEYLMRDSLHLRPQVVVRGTPGKTILRKADAVEFPLAIDGDFGEEQITVTDPKGFDIGCGVAIWSQRVHGFHPLDGPRRLASDAAQTPASGPLTPGPRPGIRLAGRTDFIPETDRFSRIAGASPDHLVMALK